LLQWRRGSGETDAIINLFGFSFFPTIDCSTDKKKTGMNKKVAILQSNYIPWKGYFDIINHVDEFILYDIVQYTKNDWRNRNKIKTSKGLLWVTIPVLTGGLFGQRICDAAIADARWPNKHWQAIKTNYGRAEYFAKIGPFLEELYQKATAMTRLSQINAFFLRSICELLGIKTRITSATDYVLSGDRNEALIALLKQSKGDEYLTGPAAKGYLDEELFKENGIGVKWMDYSGYPEYSQLHPPFEHGVSIIDMLLNLGVADTRKHMKSFVT
jgi:hypothetical protein